MKVYENEPLKKYTTIKIGGIARKLYEPENEDELIDLVLNENFKYRIGGGSNILMNDNKVYDNVLLLKNFNTRINNLGDGFYEAGASVPLQMMIHTINNDGYGGIEYLFSVPGLIGGAVYINAGGGKEQGKSISDYIESVKVIHDDKVEVLDKSKCNFDYRNSIFKNGQYIILSVIFHFSKVNTFESEKRRKNRIQFCKKTHDYSGYNFESVFRTYNPYLLEIIRMLSKFDYCNIHFSRKTDNWILNNGKGKYKQAIRHINIVKVIHKIFRQKCETEVIIWD